MSTNDTPDYLRPIVPTPRELAFLRLLERFQDKIITAFRWPTRNDGGVKRG